MVLFDTILIVILAGFVFYGLFKGIIKMIGDLAGLIVGAWLASYYYLDFANWLAEFNIGSDYILKIVSFVVLFALASKLVSLAFSLLEKVLKLVFLIPFVKTLNRLLGAVLGFAIGSISIGLILFVISKYVPVSTSLATWLTNSEIAPFLLSAAKILMPLLPEALKLLTGII
ncbi:CvpA family protein [Patescibacteria group bacterium]|nr:CvpA family protein [Patescibacteria group bacterium]